MRRQTCTHTLVLGSRKADTTNKYSCTLKLPSNKHDTNQTNAIHGRTSNKTTTKCTKFSKHYSNQRMTRNAYDCFHFRLITYLFSYKYLYFDKFTSKQMLFTILSHVFHCLRAMCIPLIIGIFGKRQV